MSVLVLLSMMGARTDRRLKLPQSNAASLNGSIGTRSHPVPIVAHGANGQIQQDTPSFLLAQQVPVIHGCIQNAGRNGINTAENWRSKSLSALGSERQFLMN